MSALRDWTADLEQATAYFVKHGDVMQEAKVPKRVVSYACFPLCCGPCIVWSCLYRVLAYPFRCGQTGCTDATDECAGGYIADLEKRRELPEVPDRVGANQRDIQALDMALSSLQKVFTVPTFTLGHYRLVDAVVKPIARACHIPMQSCAPNLADQTIKRARYTFQEQAVGSPPLKGLAPPGTAQRTSLEPMADSLTLRPGNG